MSCMATEPMTPSRSLADLSVSELRKVLQIREEIENLETQLRVVLRTSNAGRRNGGRNMIEPQAQARLSLLMDKNNEGQLTHAEAKELEQLGEYAERLSLENARALVEAFSTRRAGAAAPSPRKVAV